MTWVHIEKVISGFNLFTSWRLKDVRRRPKTHKYNRTNASKASRGSEMAVAAWPTSTSTPDANEVRRGSRWCHLVCAASSSFLRQTWRNSIKTAVSKPTLVAFQPWSINLHFYLPHNDESGPRVVCTEGEWTTPDIGTTFDCLENLSPYSGRVWTFGGNLEILLPQVKKV